MPNQAFVVVKHCICYKLEQDRSSAAERMMGNNEPLCKVTKYELMTNMADIKVSLSLHKRTIVMRTGKKGFHKISSANQQAGNDGHACG